MLTYTPELLGLPEDVCSNSPHLYMLLGHKRRTKLYDTEIILVFYNDIKRSIGNAILGTITDKKIFADGKEFYYDSKTHIKRINGMNYGMIRVDDNDNILSSALTWPEV